MNYTRVKDKMQQQSPNTLFNCTYKTTPTFTFKQSNVPCKVLQCHDGDTVYLAIEFNKEIIKLCCRLYGVDAPELAKTPEKALPARNRLAQLCTDCDIEITDATPSGKLFLNKIANNNKIIKANFMGVDKYGRQLVILIDEDDTIINDVLVQEGHCHVYFGAKKMEW